MEIKIQLSINSKNNVVLPPLKSESTAFNVEDMMAVPSSGTIDGLQLRELLLQAQLFFIIALLNQCSAQPFFMFIFLHLLHQQKYCNDLCEVQLKDILVHVKSNNNCKSL